MSHLGTWALWQLVPGHLAPGTWAPCHLGSWHSGTRAPRYLDAWIPVLDIWTPDKNLEALEGTLLRNECGIFSESIKICDIPAPKNHNKFIIVYLGLCETV